MCRGWAIGSDAFCRDLRADVKTMTVAGDWGGAELGELNRLQWQRRLEKGAARLGFDLAQIRAVAKSAPAKIALAAWLKRGTSVTNRWLSDQLHMGAPDAVSRYIGEFERGQRPAARPLHARLPADFRD